MLSLAVLPSIALLIYIYKKDKREKEPFGLLLKLFIFGALIVIPILIMETIIGYGVSAVAVEGSVAYAAMEGFFVAAFSEELFKYLAMKGRTWKSKAFNCSFDGIVYAVFVSLGFATVENIMYVMEDGFASAILRMFTAVPGHACDAVFMGYFYSLAKKAELDGNKRLMKKNKRKALIVPILFHGIYDCLISFDEAVVGENTVLLGVLLWIVLIIVEFSVAFMIVHKASKNDSLLCPAYELGEANPNLLFPIEGDDSDVPDGSEGNAQPSFALKKGTWICSCRNINNTNFCPVCGAACPTDVQ